VKDLIFVAWLASLASIGGVLMSPDTDAVADEFCKSCNDIDVFIARVCGRNFDRLCFWDSSAESGVIHRTPTESEAGAHVDKDG
jgi:hypothetical protein